MCEWGASKCVLCWEGQLKCMGYRADYAAKKILIKQIMLYTCYEHVSFGCSCSSGIQWFSRKIKDKKG